MSNASLFDKIKGSLLSSRRVFSVEARLIIKQTNQSIYQNPSIKDYRVFLKLAKEAFKRDEFNEALSNIQKCLVLLENTSHSLNKFDRVRIYEFAAIVYKKNYREHESINYLQKSLTIIEKILDRDNIYSSNIIYELMVSYFKNNMPKEVIIYSCKYLRIRSVRLSNNKRTKLFGIFLLGVAYYHYLGSEKSLRVLKQGLRLSKENFKSNKDYQFIFLRKIGKIHLDLYKKGKAAKCFKQCLDSLKDKCFRKQVPKEEIYDLLIKYYRTIEMPDRSLYYAKRAIKYFKNLKDGDCLLIAKKYRDLSYIYSDKKNLEKEFYYYSKYLVILHKIVGSNHSGFVISFLEYFNFLILKSLSRIALKKIQNIPKEFKDVLRSNSFIRVKYKLAKGTIYKDLGMTKKASKKLKEAKRLTIKLFGKHSPKYIVCCHEIGSNMIKKRQLKKALVVFRKTLKASQSIYSYFSLPTAQILYLIGLTYSKKGEITKSLKYMKKYLYVLSTIGLENTHWTKIAYLIVSNLYMGQGRLKLFFYYLRKSLDLKTTDNLQEIRYYQILFWIIVKYYFERKQYKAAKKMCMKRLKSELSSSEYDYSEVVSLIDNIVKCEINLRNYSNLKSLYALCKKVYEESVKNEVVDRLNSGVPRIYLIKAYCYYYYLKNNEECLSTLKTVLLLQREYSEKYDACMMPIYNMLTLVYIDIGKYIESLKFDKLSLKTILNTLRNPFIISDIYESIGNAYKKLGNFDKRFNFHKKSLQIRKRIYNKHNENLKRSYHLIAIYYFEHKKFDTALKYLSKAFLNSTVSTNMSIQNSLILNSIGCVYISKDNRLANKALRIFEMCEECSRGNKFGNIYTEFFTYNLRGAKNMIERERNLLKEGNQYTESSGRNLISFQYACGPLKN